MKLRFQAGVESFKDNVRTIRITPLDQQLEVPPMVGELLLAVAASMDSRDFQPGDGELDIPLKELPASVKSALGSFVVPKGNAFVRVSRVAESTPR